MAGSRVVLHRIADSVSDTTPVDWEAEASSHPDLVAHLERLQLVERVASAHRELAAVSDRDSPQRGGPAGAGNPKPTEETEVLAPAGAARTWGRLRILGRLGAGGFGEVFRAFDPMLAVEVALKLRRADRAGSDPFAGRFLHEARRLAQVRHPHVLVVHGADQHDGAIGLWTELLKGKTLEQCLLEQGPFGPQEAALIGLDLCKALAAVHAAGLVHRDIKTANVMREEGGRIVLMDFGAVTAIAPDDGDGSRAISGTPVAMAPEVLRGEPAGPQSDLYSLGVLLYRLVSGRYPIEANSWTEILSRHERGELTPLRDVRAELPAAFVQVVERALAIDPARRFASAGALEQALAATIGTGPPATARSAEAAPLPARPSDAAEATGAGSAARRAGSLATLHPGVWLLALPLALLVLLGLPWIRGRGEPPVATGPPQKSPAESIVLPPPTAPGPESTQAAPSTRAGGEGRESVVPPPPSAPPRASTLDPGQRSPGVARRIEPQEPDPVTPATTPPAAELRVAATIYREGQDAHERLVPGSRVRPGDRLFLEIEGSEPIYLYVLNEDTSGASFVLFPLPGLAQHNPLAADVVHRIPGLLFGEEQSWQVTTAGGQERFLLVAAREPLPDIERALVTLDRATPGRPFVLDAAAAVRVRSIGGLVPSAGKPRAGVSTLDQLAEGLPATAATTEGVWVREIELTNPGP